MKLLHRLSWVTSSRAVILLLGLLWAAGAGAQPQLSEPTQVRRQDSLRHLLQADQRLDTARVNRLYRLGFALRTNAAAQAIELLKPALLLAQRLDYRSGIVNTAFGLGYCYRATNAYDSALHYTTRAVELATKLGDNFNQVRGLYNLARIYHEQGNYGQALAVGLRGLSLAQAQHDQRARLFLLTQLGLTNIALGDYATAQQTLEPALALAQARHDPVGTGHAYTALGDLRRAQSRWLAAGHYYAQAAAAYRPVYNAAGLLPTELSQAEMLARRGAYSAAQRAARQLLARARATGTTGQLARTQQLMASISLATGQPDTARYYATQSLAITRRRGLKREAHATAQLLAQAAARLGHWAEAYRYQCLTSAYADSLTNEDIRHQVAARQLAFDRSQQQAQIRLLMKRVRLQAQRQELARLHYRQQVAALVALALLVLVASGYLLWRYRRREARRQEALRTRIAADLHDEVGSMLTQISMQSTLLREGHYAPAQQQAYLDQMAEASRRAARQMSDAVWSIDARYDSATSLLDRLHDHAHEVLPPAHLELDFWADASVTSLTLPLATRQALYYIYKEALHNVVKHARARLVQVRLRRLPRWLELEVRDDGQGLPQPSRLGGQGLPNMRMRAEALGGTSTLGAAEPGTVLVVRLPLR
jgi:signal transduction histidine kinase